MQAALVAIDWFTIKFWAISYRSTPNMRRPEKEFYSHPRNQEKDENGKFIHKFTPEEQTEFFYSFPENKDKTFTPVVKPPVTRESMGRKDSGIVKVSDLRDSITDANGANFLKDIDSIALNGATTAI